MMGVMLLRAGLTQGVTNASAVLFAVGIEGSDAFCAQLARNPTRSGLKVIEVDRRDRNARRMRGKSDPIDA